MTNKERNFLCFYYDAKKKKVLKRFILDGILCDFGAVNHRQFVPYFYLTTEIYLRFT